MEFQQDAKVAQADTALIYDDMAKHYDVWARISESKARKLSLSGAKVNDGQQTLEVAVGTGLTFLELVRRNPSGRNVGIDISKGMLAKAEARLRDADTANYELLEASAFDIPAGDEAFDLVVNSYMFDLIARADWERILSEFRRVLRPEGRLVLTNMTLGEKFGSGVFERVSARAPRLFGGCRGVRLSAALAASGFEVRQRRYVQQSLFPSEVILARKPRPER